MKYFWAVVVALFASSGMASEYEYLGHRYVFVSAPKIKWTEAKERAEKMGGYLMCVESSGEQKFVESILAKVVKKDRKKRNIWIGATNIDGSWKWVNGKDVVGGNWYKPTNEPNGDKGGKNSHYAHIFYGRYWNDDPNGSHKSKPIAGFFVEYDGIDDVAEETKKAPKIASKSKPKLKPKLVVEKKTKPKKNISAELEPIKTCSCEPKEPKKVAKAHKVNNEKDKKDTVDEDVVVKRVKFVKRSNND
jgi:hypothetical protein